MSYRRIGNKGRPGCPLVQSPGYRARSFMHFEMDAPAMFLGPLPKRDEELLKERHRFLTTGHVD